MIDNEKVQKHLDIFVSSVKDNLEDLSRELSFDFYKRAVELILTAEKDGNRVHITGIGKPGHLAGYIASLMSSTGTPAYFLDGTEAVHGSSGQVRPGDVVIAISNSGETGELKNTVTTLKRNGAKIIAVTGNKDSWLAREGDAFLHAPIICEGDSLNRAPRNSIMSETYVLQGLSIILQSIKDITPIQYVRWHPGGSLGKLREGEI